MRGNDLKVGFPIASVWFGALVGTSLLTGVFGTVYFAPFGGAWSIILVLITTLISVFVTYFSAEIARRNKAYDFGSLSKALYGKYTPVLGTIIDLYMIITVLTGAGGMVATMGGIINQLFGLPEWYGFVVLAVIASLLTIFGAKVVRAAGSVMSVILIVGLLALTGIVVYLNAGNWGSILSSWVPAEGYSVPSGIKGAAVLGAFGAGICMQLCAVQQTLQSKSNTMGFTVCSLVMIFFAYFVSSLLVVPYIPEVLADEIPVLTVIQKHFGKLAGVGSVLYTATMFFALVSSAVPAMLSCIARVNKYYPKKGVFEKPVTRSVITAILYWVCALLFSLLGLKRIVGTVYTYLGYIAIVLIVVPCVILQPIKWVKQKRMSSEAE